MQRLVILLALITPAACTSSSETSAPAQSAAAAPASHYDFSDLASKEIQLAQFIKDCQARTGFNFTYGPEAGAVIEKSKVVFNHSEPLTPEAFEAALDQVLQPCGLDTRHIGPPHLRVIEVFVRK